MHNSNIITPSLPFIDLNLSLPGSIIYYKVDIVLNPQLVKDNSVNADTFQTFCKSFHSIFNIHALNSFFILPLGLELRPLWTPSAQKLGTPPADWKFDERIKLAFEQPETHPLIYIWKIISEKYTIEQYIDFVIEKIKAQYGDDSVVNIQIVEQEESDE